MSHNTLPTVAELSGEMRERLAKVKYVFTDLDATMLAPGSCVLRDKYREVTVGMRGDVPDDEVQAILDEAGCGLVWACNGHLTHLSKPTTLELDRVEDGRAFNINPAGLNKGVAIARFCEHLGIEREETLALGDSESDFFMADHVGTFCLVENGLASAGAPEFLDTCDNAYVTCGKIVDGWAATAELLVAARS